MSKTFDEWWKEDDSTRSIKVDDRIKQRIREAYEAGQSSLANHVLVEDSRHELLLKAEQERDSLKSQLEQEKENYQSQYMFTFDLRRQLGYESKLSKDLQRHLSESQLREGVMREALKPLVTIAEKWNKDELDESRPHEWEETKGQAWTKEIYTGRGGATLLTLGDCFNAQDALSQSTTGLYEKVTQALQFASCYILYIKNNNIDLHNEADGSISTEREVEELLTLLGHATKE